MFKNLFFLILALTLGLLFSCEDPGLIKSDKNFSQSRLQTIYVDTISIVTSTILIDSLPTSGINNLLVGNYQDPFLGQISASTYFQIGYQQIFAPQNNATFDSIGLILPYSRYYYGDTTQSQTIRVYQMTSQPKTRKIAPYRTDENLSYFVVASVPSLYNSSKVSFNPVPLTTFNVKFQPKRDSLYIAFPKSLGQSWFDLAKAEAAASSSSFFNNPNLFVTDFFNGIHIASDGTSNASVVGFKTAKAKVRIYYKQLQGDIMRQFYFDFQIGNASTQFNSIVADRKNTTLSSLSRKQALSSSLTGNVTYVQSGTGLATKIEFPSLKSFFSKKNFVLIDAVLEVVPVQNTYQSTTRVPSTLALYLTDQTNVVLNRAPTSDRSGYISARISYDLEYGLNTKYTFPLVNYLSNELKSNLDYVTPLVIAAPTPEYLTEVNRVVIGDQKNSQHKIKLKIFYSYAPNQ